MVRPLAHRAAMAQTKPARKRTSRWSARVTRKSDALDLSRGVFTWKDPKRIAGSLKRSAERSKRRKSDPYRSALSMLTFYLNRAGKNLPATRRKTLQRAKAELRKQFGRDDQSRSRAAGAARPRRPRNAPKRVKR